MKNCKQRLKVKFTEILEIRDLHKSKTLLFRLSINVIDYFLRILKAELISQMLHDEVPNNIFRNHTCFHWLRFCDFFNFKAPDL